MPLQEVFTPSALLRSQFILGSVADKDPHPFWLAVHRTSARYVQVITKVAWRHMHPMRIIPHPHPLVTRLRDVMFVYIIWKVNDFCQRDCVKWRAEILVKGFPAPALVREKAASENGTAIESKLYNVQSLHCLSYCMKRLDSGLGVLPHWMSP